MATSKTKKNNNKKKPTNTNKKKTTNTAKTTKSKVNSVSNKNNTTKKSSVTTQKTVKQESTLDIKKYFSKIKEFFSNLKKKYKKLPTYTKIILISLCVCIVIIVVEGLLVLSHKRQLENSQVFYERYTGVSVDSTSAVISGTTDIKETMFDTNIKDNSRGIITKYDNKGNIEFQNTYEKGIATAFNSVITVEDGYIVVGSGIFSEEEKNNEGQEAIIIKYSKDGEIVWEKYYHVLTNTIFNKVIEVSDGYIAVGQSIYANLEVGNHTTGGAIIVKYDFNGNEVWHNNHGGTKSGNFNDVVEVNGSLYAVGKDGTDWGNLVKFTKDGKYEWHKNYSYTDGSGFMGITSLGDYLYVVGSKKIIDSKLGDNDDRSATNTDAVFIKYDLEGNIVFEKTFGGSSYERYNSIIAYHNNFYIVGHLCSDDAGLKITSKESNIMTGLIVRYDINGNILKKEVFGGSKNDNLTDINTDGISFYAVGYSNSKDGNISSGSNGKDYLGKLLKLNSKFKKMYIK